MSPDGSGGLYGCRAAGALPASEELLMPAITPCLWFDTRGQEAAEFYVSVFPNSRITDTSYYGEVGPGTPGTVLTVEFELDGHRFTALNGGPQFTFSEAVSFQIDCADQDEVDHYWTGLTAECGEEGPCGWVKYRFGVSWQVVPRRLVELLADAVTARSQRAIQDSLGMGELDIAATEAAAEAG